MNAKALMLFFLLLINFLHSGETQLFNDEKSDIEKNNFFYQIWNQISQTYLLEPVAYGGSIRMPSRVFNVMFNVYFNKPLTREDARYWIVKIVEEHVAGINESLGLQKFLPEKPFKVNNICLSLLVYDSRGGNYLYPEISAINSYDGRIRYSSDYPYVPGTPCESEDVRESYEEALQILKDHPVENPQQPVAKKRSWFGF